jgi:hypothetical protein
MSDWILKLKGKDQLLVIEEISEFIERLKKDREFEYVFGRSINDKEKCYKKSKWQKLGERRTAWGKEVSYSKSQEEK